jgi:hypothetical protein
VGKDEWHFLGIRAKATIKIPYGTNPDCWITSEFSSPGLWGIRATVATRIFRKSTGMNARF